MKKIVNKALLLSAGLFLVCIAHAKGGKTVKEYQQLIKQHVYADYKQMFRKPSGNALIYPYITPGSKSYDNVLWDWDSWLSDVALRQILEDIGTENDLQEAFEYEQGCVLNYLAYTSPEDGYMPMVIDGKTNPDIIKPKDKTDHLRRITCKGWVSVSTSPEKIKKTKAYKTIRKSLLDQLERGGNDLPHFKDLVEDYMKMYVIKEMANDDILERGTYVEWRNSDTQYGSKKNDSVDQILKTNQQMIKLLDKLGISPDAGMDDMDEDM